MCLCIVGAALGFLLGSTLALALGLPPYTFGLLGAGVGLLGDIKLFRRLNKEEKQVVRKPDGGNNV